MTPPSLTPIAPQNSMNLPPDKMKLLNQYDNEKKWELICDQVRSGRHCVPGAVPVPRCHSWCGHQLGTCQVPTATAVSETAPH